MTARRSEIFRAIQLFATGGLVTAALLQIKNLPMLVAAFSANNNFARLAAAANIFEAAVVAISAVVAFNAYQAAMRTAAQQNTLERIFQDHADREVVEQRTIFRQVKNGSSDKLANYAFKSDADAFVQRCIDEETPKGETFDPSSKKNARKIRKWRGVWAKRQSAIVAVLNRYETFAIGISEKAIDEDLYKRWWRSQLVGDWNAAREIIEKIREHSPAAFNEFQRLAARWDEEIMREMADGGHG